MDTLKYADEKDRAYGLSGMAVAMVVWDSDSYIRSINLDAEADAGIVFTPAFFTQRNPKGSARAAWNDSVERFQLLSGMIISNVLCRALVRQKQEITPGLRQSIVKLLNEEGHEACGLADSEVETIFTKAYSYFHKIFSHSAIAGIAERLVAELEHERSLDRDTLLEFLAPLQRL